ncbi:MAG TPA: hypothetical protein ENG65_02425 [Candidatus Bathyarchaeota archaeon]|nr:hypothetical protein [Candidatus Bathyarchaeota archaeon]
MNKDVEEVILSVIDEFSDETGKIAIEDIYRILKQRYNIDRISAGKAIVRLYGKGKIAPIEYYYLRRTD